MAAPTPTLRQRRRPQQQQPSPAQRRIVISHTQESEQWQGDSWQSSQRTSVDNIVVVSPPAILGVVAADDDAGGEGSQQHRQAPPDYRPLPRTLERDDGAILEMDVEDNESDLDAYIPELELASANPLLTTRTTTVTTTLTATTTTTVIVEPHSNDNGNSRDNNGEHQDLLALGFTDDNDGSSHSSGSNNGDSSAPYTPSPIGGRVRVVQFQTTLCDLAQAAIVGSLTGVSVAFFKLSVEAVRQGSYKYNNTIAPILQASIPAVGGAIVGTLLLLGGAPFAPGLKGMVQQVILEGGECRDLKSHCHLQLDNVRKLLAAIATLGSGCSLGPEGPCVECGMSVARACMDLQPQRDDGWKRLLLACGAAAGVAAGFNAPIGGVFFALEVMQNAFNEGIIASVAIQGDIMSESSAMVASSMFSTSANITPVLIASVLSALVSRTILGNHLVLHLTQYSLKTPLVELPLYLLLGICSGFVAFCFSRSASGCQAFFAGNLGGEIVQSVVRATPNAAKPIIGGLLCGLVGLQYPQILFFGYETLNDLLANNTLPTTLLVTLLFFKTLMTAISAGSGLIGGTFAPSLFLGAMTGGIFHNIAKAVLGFCVAGPNELADVPAYAMIGAACVLAALFRAPLTASLLLFELTHDYDIILPLMVSAGIASVVADILDDKFESSRQKTRQDHDSISWGALADHIQTKAQIVVTRSESQLFQ